LTILRARTKRFAFNVINLVKLLPHNIATDAIARQLIKAGTSVCANHRAAGRARSRREFIAKLGLVVEEADEAELWLEALLRCELAAPSAVDPLYREASELRAIFVRSLQTARHRSTWTSTALVLTFVILIVTLLALMLP
jgi:four helix bundle protein